MSRAAIATLALSASMGLACGGLVGGDGPSGPDPLVDGGRSDASTARPPIRGAGWPMFGRSADRTGRSDAAPSSQPRIVWKQKLPTDSFADVVIDDSGRAYVSVPEGLFVYTGDGDLIWSHAVSAGAWTGANPVALSRDGRVFLQERDRLSTFSSSGALLGSVAVSDPSVAMTSNLLVDDDRVYVATYDRAGPYLTSVGFDGSILGRTSLPFGNVAGTARRADRSVVVAIDSTGGLDAMGHLVTVAFGGAIASDVMLPATVGAPSVVHDGRALVYSMNGVLPYDPSLIVVDPATSSSRAFPLGTVVTGPISEDSLGRFVLATAWGLMAVDSSGARAWRAPSTELPSLRLHLWSPAAIAGDGTVIVADLGSTVFGIVEGRVLWSVDLGSPPPRTLSDTSRSPSVAIGPDGTVFVCASQGRVFALR